MGKKYLFISIVFFFTIFLGYRLRILGFFQTLWKISICMVSHLNGTTDALYIYVGYKNFQRKWSKSNLFIIQYNKARWVLLFGKSFLKFCYMLSEA
jgi:fatty-acid desaturase